MSTSRHPARIVTAALVAGGCAALALAGCSAGQITQTSGQVSAVPGANVTAGAIALRNLLVQYNGIGGYPAGGDAPLVVRIFNDGATPVKLVGVRADEATVVTLVGVPTPQGSPAPVSPSPAASPSESAAPSPSPSGEPAASATPSATASAVPSASPTKAPAPPSSVSDLDCDPTPVLRGPGAG